MKNNKKTLVVFIAILCLLSCFNFASCNENQQQMQIPKFTTQYTEQEHVQRIEQYFREYLRKGHVINRGEIKDIYVEILYSYHTHDPEYALIEIEYTQPFSRSFDKDGEKSYTTKYRHTYVRITNDNYYVACSEYSNSFETCKDGQSVYTVLGYKNNKKYFGDLWRSVEIDGQITDIVLPKIEMRLFLGQEYWTEQTLSNLTTQLVDQKTEKERYENVYKKYKDSFYQGVASYYMYTYVKANGL